MTLAPSIAQTQPGPSALRTALFLLLLTFLNLQSDGFRLSANPSHDQLLLLPFTILFCVLFTAVVWPYQNHPYPRLAALNNSRTLLAFAIATLAPSLAMLVASAHHYAAFRYHLALWPTLIVFAGAALLLAANLHASDTASTAGRLLTSVLIAFLAVDLLSLRSFPINIGRSDMLPLLAAAGRTLHNGLDPYRLYTFATETVLLTYLPGTLLAYLPATLLHLDLRLTNLVCLTLLTLLIARAATPAHRRQLTALLAVWLLSPYLLYRHEIYTPPHWLVLVAALLLLNQRRLTASALLFGFSIAVSQFSWILFPFVLLYLFERHRTRVTLIYAATALLPALLILLPFFLWSPPAFTFGVLSHWQQQTVSARPVNLSFWLAALLGPRALQPVQLLVLAAVFLASAARHSCRTFPGLLRVLALALTAFILLNILVWGYFFLLIELLLLLFVASANGWLQTPPEPSLSRHRSTPRVQSAQSAPPQTSASASPSQAAQSAGARSGPAPPRSRRSPA